MVNPNSSSEQGLGCGFMSKLLQGEERSLSVGLLVCFASVLWQDDSVFSACDVLVFLFKVKNLKLYVFFNVS